LSAAHDTVMYAARRSSPAGHPYLRHDEGSAAGTAVSRPPLRLADAARIAQLVLDRMGREALYES
jgi:hypothetical protein